MKHEQIKQNSDKKRFIAPTMEVIRFHADDIVTASGNSSSGFYGEEDVFSSAKLVSGPKLIGD